MTSYQLLWVLLRRWYVVLAGAALTLAIGYHFAVVTPLYWARSELLFVEGPSRAWNGSLGGSSEDLVPFVAVIERLMNEGKEVTRLNSTEASLYGVGVREGSRVEMPNAGSQWNYSFPRPALIVEVVGSNPAQVLAADEATITRVRETARALQKAEALSKSKMVTVFADPGTPRVVYVGTTRGQQLRAVVVIVMLGTGCTAALARYFDRWAVTRRGDQRSGTCQAG